MKTDAEIVDKVKNGDICADLFVELRFEYLRALLKLKDDELKEVYSITKETTS